MNWLLTQRSLGAALIPLPWAPPSLAWAMVTQGKECERQEPDLSCLSLPSPFLGHRQPLCPHSSTVPPSTHPSLQSPRGVPLVCCLSHFSLYNPRLIYGKTARSPCSISMCRDPQPLLTSWLVFQDLAGVEQGVGGAGCALHNSMG